MIALRPLRFDELGLKRALADRMVPFLVASMAFLAALALAGWTGAATLARHWDSGAGSTLTVQVPRPGEPDTAGAGTRLAAVVKTLSATPGVASAKALSDEQMNTLLRPWLGTDMKGLTVSVPAVVSVHLSDPTLDLMRLSARLVELAPSTVLEDHASWSGRLGALARSLQLCSGLVLLIVTMVTAAVIAVATRSGLAQRRDAVMIVYQLGATDGYIAQRFATRAAVLASVGGLIGGLFSLPVLFMLATLAIPLAQGGATGGASGLAGGAWTEAFGLLPVGLWLLPLILPPAAALIGYLTAQVTMRQWLRRLS